MIEALAAASGRHVSRETFELIEAYVRILTEEATRQNLIAPSTLESVWERHILDSAQLVRFEPRLGSSWGDIGSGAGLPGLVIALLVTGSITLIEPRRLRAEFLTKTVDQLGLSGRVRIEHAKAERVEAKLDVITARAVAALDNFLALANHLSDTDTVWVLPKGKNAQSELAQAQRNWHCDVRVEQSRTDPNSEILVLTRVGTKKKR